MEHQDTIGDHLSVLAQWTVRTFGRARLGGMVAPTVIAAIAAVTGTFALFWIGLLTGPPVFAWLLITAKAPTPPARH